MPWGLQLQQELFNIIVKPTKQFILFNTTITTQYARECAEIAQKLKAFLTSTGGFPRGIALFKMSS